MRRTNCKLIRAVATIAALLLIGAGPVLAATRTVNAPGDVIDASGCDASHCSLREALAVAVTGDRVEFDLTLPATIQLAHGELVIEQGVEIVGPGASRLTIRAGRAESPTACGRVMQVATFGETVTISGLTLTGGKASGCRVSGGGGLFFDDPMDGKLVLRSCDIRDNDADASLYGGGGILAGSMYGELILEGCSVRGNHADGVPHGGGAVSMFGGTVLLLNTTLDGNRSVSFGATTPRGGGALYLASASAVVCNSTLSGNVADSTGWGGGGILSLDSEVELRNVTLTDNSADLCLDGGGGGGIAALGESDVRYTNSIVAGNRASQNDGSSADCMHDSTQYLVSNGDNLLVQGKGCSDSTGDRMVPHAFDARIGPLAMNGGAVKTHLLLAGSPAIDAGSACTDHRLQTLTADQRGIERPLDGNGDLQAVCDIGAVEFQMPLLVVLDSLTANLSDEGVAIDWVTIAEIDNVGFRVLRSRGAESSAIEVSRGVIPARGSELYGAEYRFVDAEHQRPGTTWYYLEDIDRSGHVARHGPVEVVIPGPSDDARNRRERGRRGFSRR